MRLHLPNLQRRPALWQHILPILRHAILSGQFPPGTRLIPERLASELGVSRGPVTEAIRRLAEEGLVVLAPNGRPFVRGLTHRYLRDLYEFRTQLDLLAIKTALAAPEPPDLGPLWEAVAAMRMAQASSDIDALAESDIAFHRDLIALARNAVFNQVWAGIADFSRSLLTVTDKLQTASPSVPDIHAAIATAIAARDLVQVEEAVRAHYRYGEDLLVSSGLVYPVDDWLGPAPQR